MRTCRCSAPCSFSFLWTTNDSITHLFLRPLIWELQIPSYTRAELKDVSALQERRFTLATVKGYHGGMLPLVEQHESVTKHQVSK